MQKITPCLWFDTQVEEAANFYVSVFKDGKLGTVMRYDEASAKVSGMPAGSVLTVEFQINGMDFLGMNGGPAFKFNEAVSFIINCEDQEEVDYYWEKLSAVPESEQCGWLKDKFGVSWQVVPKNMNELVSTPAGMKAMLGMKKIDIQGLRDAK
jgi:predicted 3-demethylubiquinone-9 3-methyltransferase (glyoxalase superfamily)